MSLEDTLMKTNQILGSILSLLEQQTAAQSLDSDPARWRLEPLAIQGEAPKVASQEVASQEVEAPAAPKATKATGRRAAQSKEPVAKAEPLAPELAPVTEPSAPTSATFDDCKLALRGVAQAWGVANGRAKSLEVLAKFGASILPEVPDNRFVEFVNECRLSAMGAPA